MNWWEEKLKPSPPKTKSHEHSYRQKARISLSSSFFPFVTTSFTENPSSNQPFIFLLWLIDMIMMQVKGILFCDFYRFSSSSLCHDKVFSFEHVFLEMLLAASAFALNMYIKLELLSSFADIWNEKEESILSTLFRF